MKIARLLLCGLVVSTITILACEALGLSSAFMFASHLVLGGILAMVLPDSWTNL